MYSDAFKVAWDSADGPGRTMISQVKNCLDHPLDFFMRTESPEDRDPTWTQSLPNEALRLFMYLSLIHI